MIGKSLEQGVTQLRSIHMACETPGQAKQIYTRGSQLSYSLICIYCVIQFMLYSLYIGVLFNCCTLGLPRDAVSTCLVVYTYLAYHAYSTKHWAWQHKILVISSQDCIDKNYWRLGYVLLIKEHDWQKMLTNEHQSALTDTSIK